MVGSLFTSETYLRDSCAAFFLASISPLDSRSNCNRYLVIKVQYLLTKATLIANGLNTGVLVVQTSSYWYSVIILVGEIWKDLSVPLETMTGVKSEWKEFVRWWFCKSGLLKLNGHSPMISLAVRLVTEAILISTILVTLDLLNFFVWF